jgi:hypothetical protein
MAEVCSAVPRRVVPGVVCTVLFAGLLQKQTESQMDCDFVR